MPTIEFFQPHEGRQFDGPLDPTELLIRHPAATFFMRAGAECREAGVRSGDLLVIDRAVDPRPGRIVVAVRSGEMRVERVPYAGADELEVWGVVTHLIREL